MNTKRSYYKDSDTIIIVYSLKFKKYTKEYIGGDSSLPTFKSEKSIQNIQLIKSKITEIPNSEKNSKRKVPNQMAKSKAQTHQTNG